MIACLTYVSAFFSLHRPADHLRDHPVHRHKRGAFLFAGRESAGPAPAQPGYKRRDRRRIETGSGLWNFCPHHYVREKDDQCSPPLPRREKAEGRGVIGLGERRLDWDERIPHGAECRAASGGLAA